MIFVLYTLHIIVCLFLILVILLQQGSGADLSVFGGGSTQAAFGARGATQVVHKLTVWGFIAFILLTLTIAVMQGGATGSIVRDVDEEPLAGTALEGEAPLESDASDTTEYVAEELQAEEGQVGEAEADGATGPVEAAGDAAETEDDGQ